MKEDDRKTLDRRKFIKVAGAQTGLIVAATSGAGALAQQQGPPSPAPRKAPAVVGQKSPDVAVIGAGAFGGWTAYHLQKMGAKVTLIDTWGPGDSRSTSGEETRGLVVLIKENGHWKLAANQNARIQDSPVGNQ